MKSAVEPSGNISNKLFEKNLPNIDIFSTVFHGLVSDCMHVKADIVFMLDSSSSEGATNFQKQRDFVASFVRSLTIGPSNVQVGVVTFSTTAKVNFDLNDHTTKPSVLSAINQISYIQGSTHTDLGLNLVWTRIFGQLGDRADAQNILYILTDGQSSSPSATTVQADLVRNHNIKTYAIGIGATVRRNELNSIAMTSNYVIQVSDFSNLQSIAAKLKDDLCSGTCHIRNSGET